MIAVIKNINQARTSIGILKLYPSQEGWIRHYNKAWLSERDAHRWAPSHKTTHTDHVGLSSADQSRKHIKFQLSWLALKNAFFATHSIGGSQWCEAFLTGILYITGSRPNTSSSTVSPRFNSAQDPAAWGWVVNVSLSDCSEKWGIPSMNVQVGSNGHGRTPPQWPCRCFQSDRVPGMHSGAVRRAHSDARNSSCPPSNRYLPAYVKTQWQTGRLQPDRPPASPDHPAPGGTLAPSCSSQDAFQNAEMPALLGQGCGVAETYPKIFSLFFDRQVDDVVVTGYNDGILWSTTWKQRQLRPDVCGRLRGRCCWSDHPDRSPGRPYWFARKWSLPFEGPPGRSDSPQAMERPI